MNKYIIEGNIDFYKELYDAHDNENEDNTNICLITQLPLTDKYVVLECGHKFNYEPLYNDIFNHKTNKKVIIMEKRMLKTYELRCPYCRNIQKGLLPYHSDLPFKKVNGVNYFNSKKELFKSGPISIGNCEYEQSIEGEVTKCKDYVVVKIDLLNKCFCFNHKKQAIIEFLNLEKEDKKNKLIQEKIKMKEDKIKLKEEKIKKLNEQKNMKQKDKLKEEKDKLKEDTTSNIVLEIKDNECQCIHILKTGKNKDSQCSGKTYKNNLCLRHYNKLI